jgi:hypothetical protein
VHQSRKSSFHAIRAASQKPLCDAACARSGVAGSSYKSIQMIKKKEMDPEFLRDELMAVQVSKGLLQIYCTVEGRMI